MTNGPDVDLQAVHQHFSAKCFNQVWRLLDEPDRSSEEDERMIRLSLASHWHWTRREDCTSSNISAAYWQTSRVYAVLGRAENAMRYAQLCLIASQRRDVGPFYLAYAYEALARAALVGGNREQMERYRMRAHE